MRFDQVAAVVAETAQQASQAVDMIRVEYQDLPIIATLEQAMIKEAPVLHADYPGNIAHSIRIRRGNTESALAQAALVFEEEYRTPMQEHAYLELESGMAYIDDTGTIVVRAAGQNPHDDQLQIAKALDLPLDRVRVVYGLWVEPSGDVKIYLYKSCWPGRLEIGSTSRYYLGSQRVNPGSL